MEVKYPSLSERFQSTFIDTLLIVVMMFICSAILERMNEPEDWVRIAMFAGIWLVYEPLCTALGCTLGNYIKGIRVRRESDTTKRINFFQALIRYIVKVLLGWLSFLTIGTNAKKRAIHDMISGSVMIKL